LAKQFGVGDGAIAGLSDPERFPFPPDQKAALRFADAMTEGGGEVSDDLYDDLRRHFTEAQIVEVAAVIGLFNYFNRFNNAFRMDITLTDPDVVVRRAEEAATEEGDARTLSERIVEILAQGRRYLWVGVYRREKGAMILLAHRGPSTLPHSFRVGEGNVGASAGRSELVVPVRGGTDVLGVIDARGDREGAFGEEDRALVERVASILAPALAGGHATRR
jgi:putative methionine-R-sulfoxide reductase with GAF domain